jgi:hypothetical protein
LAFSQSPNLGQPGFAFKYKYPKELDEAFVDLENLPFNPWSSRARGGGSEPMLALGSRGNIGALHDGRSAVDIHPLPPQSRLRAWA